MKRHVYELECTTMEAYGIETVYLRAQLSKLITLFNRYRNTSECEELVLRDLTTGEVFTRYNALETALKVLEAQQ